MNYRYLLSWIFLLTGMSPLLAQKSSTYYFDQPILTDSASTLLIPISYDESSFVSSKLSLGNGYYANIIFYDFTKDIQKKLFETETYIISFARMNHNYSRNKEAMYNLVRQHILYQVRNTDYNANGKIDEEDPVILYVSDTKGNNLKSLSSPTENVVGFTLYEKQNFVLVKIQKDQNNDHIFNSKDKDYYLVKLDLTTFVFGSKIELK